MGDRRTYNGKHAQLFYDAPLIQPGPELDAMNEKAATFVRRFVQGDELDEVLELLGLDQG